MALATNMLIADGSDMASPGNPRAFCGGGGLRPSPGRVPVWPTPTAWSTLSVDGPMARSVADLALMLSAIAGPDARSPIAIHESGSRFASPPEADFKGVRVAWWRDLGGVPVDRRVRAAVDAQRRVFEALGCIVDEAEPDFIDFDAVFKTVRALAFLTGVAPRVDGHRDQVKETILWEIERGEHLTVAEIVWAETKRTEIYHRMRRFMGRMISSKPTAGAAGPDQPYLTETTARWRPHDWMKSCQYIRRGNHEIPVPCGFTPGSRPFDQAVSRRLGSAADAHVLEPASSGSPGTPD